MPQIDILMAAYNGEKYIAEQIDSILAQTFQDFRLIIRDDGSSDNTPAIIEDYARRYPGKIEAVHDDVVCHDLDKNFFQLLTYARADYAMFSDQDDVWLPYKIQVTLWHVKKAEAENPGKPVLAFFGVEIVDEDLLSTDKFMNLGLPRDKYTFETVTKGNHISGNTIMFNRTACEGMGQVVGDIHDKWAVMYAASCGIVVQVPMSLLLYRQHGHNVVGAAMHFDGWRVKFSRLLRHPLKKFRYGKLYSRRTCNLCTLFRDSYSSAMYPEKLEWLNNYIELCGKSRRRRFAALRRMHYLSELDLYSKITCVLKLILY